MQEQTEAIREHYDAKALLSSVPGLRTETVFGQESILTPTGTS